MPTEDTIGPNLRRVIAQLPTNDRWSDAVCYMADAVRLDNATIVVCLWLASLGPRCDCRDRCGLRV